MENIAKTAYITQKIISNQCKTRNGVIDLGDVIYMEVTKDEYELPVAVADSVTELARLVGIGKSGVSKGISYAERYGARCKYIKVVLEDDEHED